MTADHSEQLLVFSDDWGRHPSSCQHLIRALLPRYQVHWVNTIGTRPPRMDLYTLQRGFAKLGSWLFRPKATEPAAPVPAGRAGNPVVLNPLMWPSFSSSLSRGINRRLLGRAIRRAVPDLGRTRVITSLPISADLVDELPALRWLYYCVDDLSEWPGLDKPTLETMERKLVAKVDAIVAVSQRLIERMASMGRTASLLTHGVELDKWSGAKASDRLNGCQRPLAVFWGVVDQRLDIPSLERLGQRLTPGTIVLVGPENVPDPRLGQIPNLIRLGPVPYDELPGIAAAASVLIMPYADLPATRAMQPLKLKEYLATGKPVVTSNLPAVAEWRDACDVATAPEEFARRTHDRLDGAIPAEQRVARERLANEGWDRKAAEFERVLVAAD